MKLANMKVTKMLQLTIFMERDLIYKTQEIHFYH